MHRSSSLPTLICNIGKRSVPTRQMSFIHGGRLNKGAPKPNVKDVDVSGHHMVGVETVCKEPDCKRRVCSDTQQPEQCPTATPQQQIPSTGGTSTPAGFETYLTVNITHHVPSNKQGVILDQHVDYTGKPMSQSAVVESTPPKIDPKDIKVNTVASSYLQETTRHNILSNATKADHSSKTIP